MISATSRVIARRPVISQAAVRGFASSSAAQGKSMNQMLRQTRTDPYLLFSVFQILLAFRQV